MSEDVAWNVAWQKLFYKKTYVPKTFMSNFWYITKYLYHMEYGLFRKTLKKETIAEIPLLWGGYRIICQFASEGLDFYDKAESTTCVNKSFIYLML